MTPFAKMTNQPQWPKGDAPERITSIKGGFVDGAGTKHAPPPGVTEAHNINGVWYWKR